MKPITRNEWVHDQLSIQKSEYLGFCQYAAGTMPERPTHATVFSFGSDLVNKKAIFYQLSRGLQFETHSEMLGRRLPAPDQHWPFCVPRMAGF